MWLTADGVAKIGDFGIALSPTYSRVTQSHLVLGTVAYMAPEQAMGGEVDGRSDLYSLGAMLFELVTGAPPFRGHHPVAVIGQHINASPAAPSHHNAACPLGLEALILKLLAKDQGRRPQSASEVIAAVDEIGRSISHPQPVPSPDEAQNIPLRVLIMEDSEDDAVLAIRELRNGGYDPTFERVDTPEAMKAALQKGAWDLVISDHAMPHFSGPAALKIVRNSGLDLPFIITSGTISDEMAVAAMKSGAHDYVMKNNLSRLALAVERELREAELRRERQSAEDEERLLYRDLQERHRHLETRLNEISSQNRRSEEQLARYTEMVRSYRPLLEGLQRLAQDAGQLAKLAASKPLPDIQDPAGATPDQGAPPKA